MPKPNTRMTAMRQRALEAFNDGPVLQDLSGFSTTALWEVARVQLKRGNPYSLAVVLVELHRRCPPVPGGRPIELAYHVSDTPDPVSETARETVSETPVLELEPSPPPRTTADLIGILKAHGWTQARIAHEVGRDQGRVSRALNRGAKLDDEAHDKLVGLVAEVERSSS
ncbi:hypothetical protein HW932_20940 [Allochromatium humboldtianum]|uniref:Uncharacterized protein n=1 Tax=Allochromatium humboldtianum TaxID=504901 RepID=A0A850RJN4_9GAMM|nr:hypothetical protein [Allochromatium humboldtianum]NVZ11717.1 hypothetical protein [Allochromatium humboldtianum]